MPIPDRTRPARSAASRRYSIRARRVMAIGLLLALAAVPITGLRLTASASTTTAVRKAGALAVQNPAGLAVVPTQGRDGTLYVSRAQSGSVLAVNGSTTTGLRAIDTGTEPTALIDDDAPTLTRHYLYAARGPAQQVAVIDPASGTVVGAIHTPAGRPDALAIDPSTGRIYIAYGNADTLSILTPPTGSSPGFGLLTDVPLPATGTGEHLGVAVDPVTHLAFVTSYQAVGTLDLVAPDGTVDTVADAGPYPRAVVDYDGHAYVADTGSDLVQVIDPSTATAPARIVVGAMPTGLAVDPASGAIGVTSDYDAGFALIDGTANTVASTVHPPGAWSAGEIALDPVHGLLYETDPGGPGTLTEYTAAALELPSTVSLTASTGTASTGTAVTYTARPSHPSTPVRFMDGETPVPGCSSVETTRGVATCAITYRSPGRHRVTAQALARAFLYRASPRSTPTPVTVNPASETATSPPTVAPASATAAPVPVAPGSTALPGAPVGPSSSANASAAGRVPSSTMNSTPSGTPLSAVKSAAPQPVSAPKPTPTPSGEPSAVLPRINRAPLAAIPSHPNKYRGKKKRLTKDWDATYHGTDAHPVSAFRGHPMSVGQAAVLSGDSVFAFDSPKLTAAGRAQVRSLAALLPAGGSSVTCEGYTDFGGSRSHERTLSTQRAKAVCSTLRTDRSALTTAQKAQQKTALATGPAFPDNAALKIHPVGYGPAHPAVIGGKPKSRTQNRRVVILLTGTKQAGM